MSGVVLADTSPLYALADPSDQFHDRAHRELEKIVSQEQIPFWLFFLFCARPTRWCFGGWAGGTRPVG
jgi:hypothetical protein